MYLFVIVITIINYIFIICSIGQAYLAQSPQLYKQMAIASDFDRVFTVGAGKALTMLHYRILYNES